MEVPDSFDSAEEYLYQRIENVQDRNDLQEGMIMDMVESVMLLEQLLVKKDILTQEELEDIMNREDRGVE